MQNSYFEIAFHNITVLLYFSLNECSLIFNAALYLCLLFSFLWLSQYCIINLPTCCCQTPLKLKVKTSLYSCLYSVCLRSLGRQLTRFWTRISFFFSSFILAFFFYFIFFTLSHHFLLFYKTMESINFIIPHLFMPFLFFFSISG